jgi:hypothetical protein
MPKVLNKHTDHIPPDAVYVGRPSKWGNPYKIGDKHPTIPGATISREDAIILYHFHLLSLYANGRLPNFDELRGKDLVCWCAPLPCHADILLELANKKVNNVET